MIYNAHILYMYLGKCVVSGRVHGQQKQRENTEESGTVSPLHHRCQVCDHHTRGHLGCLAVYAVKKLQR